MRPRPFLIALLALPALACEMPLTLHEMARESRDGVGLIDAAIPIALADDNTVAFSASTLETVATTQDPALFVANGTDIVPIRLVPSGHAQVRSVQVNAQGTVAFLCRRRKEMITLQGVYSAPVAGGPIATEHEVELGPPGPNQPLPPHGTVALSENGTLAFSSIAEGGGDIRRGPVGGPFEVVHAGSFTFFNTSEVDLNDAGVIAVQMEYTDPTLSLARGILLFDAPGEPLSGLRTAIEKLNVSVQPAPALNANGYVAFAIDSPQTLRFYDPPNVATSTPVATLTVVPGVYIAEPTRFGQPCVLHMVADTAGDFASFGRVVLNDDDIVVFEATLDDGTQGLFTGADAACNRILGTGDSWGGVVFSDIRLGEINGRGAISVLTTDKASGERQVWVISGLEHDWFTARFACWYLVPPP